jgi:hypothetical protein
MVHLAGDPFVDTAQHFQGPGLTPHDVSPMAGHGAAVTTCRETVSR